MTETPETEYLTVAEVAARMRRSPHYVRRLCASGAITAKKVGEWRIHRDEFEAFMRPRPVTRARRRAS